MDHSKRPSDGTREQPDFDTDLDLDGPLQNLDAVADRRGVGGAGRHRSR